MSKPFFMKFTTGGNPVVVNMNLVAHIMANNPTKPDSLSVLTFNAVLNDEPAYLVVDQSLDEIGTRSEWRT